MAGTARYQDAPLLGRLEERKLLMSLLDDVTARGQALVLHGEPGIGKSRLLLRDRANGTRARHGGAHHDRCAVGGASAVCRPPPAAPTRARACERAPRRPARRARCRVRPHARGGARALPDRDGRARPRLGRRHRCAAAGGRRRRPLARPPDRGRAGVRRSANRVRSDRAARAIRDGYPSALGEAGLPEHKVVGLDDTTAAALLDAVCSGAVRSRRAPASCARRPETRSPSSSCRPWSAAARTSSGRPAACR